MQTKLGWLYLCVICITNVFTLDIFHLFFLFCFNKHLYFTVFSSKIKACIILFSLHIPVISDHGSQFMNCASCSILLLTYANRIKQVGRDLRRSLFPAQSRGSSEVRLS